jgi:hypothetical protein
MQPILLAGKSFPGTFGVEPPPAPHHSKRHIVGQKTNLMVFFSFDVGIGMEGENCSQKLTVNVTDHPYEAVTMYCMLV